jgi:protocatechuate 3,4-dioxygenase beta subunit
MQSIIATIKPGDSGPIVANLQDALFALLEHQIIRALEEPNRPTLEVLQELAEILKKEREQSIFGKATQQLITYFQIQQSLGDHLFGGVEKTTAAKLNEFLEKLDLLKNDSNFIVKGRIFDTEDGKAVADVMVRAFDWYKEVYTLLGETSTDQKGLYQIEFLEKAFKNIASDRKNPDLIVRIFDQKNKQIGQSKQIDKAERMTELDVEINTSPFRVYGVVLDSAGKPVKNANVQAFDRDLRTVQMLGDTITDAVGYYEIGYSRQKFVRSEKDTADLEIHVFDDKDALLVKSETAFNAPAEIEINLVAQSAEILTEWERITQGVIPLLEGQGPDGKPLPVWKLIDEDIFFFVKERGLEYEQVRLWVRAAKMVHEIELIWAVPIISTVIASVNHFSTNDTLSNTLEHIAFYGWFRQGLPTDWEALQVHPISLLRKALYDAIDQNIIPGKFREYVGNFLARIPNPQIKELANLLEITALAPEKIRAVLAQADGVEDLSDERLIQLVQQDTLTVNESKIIGLGVSLYRLTSGEKILVSAILDTEFTSVESGKLQHIGDLALLEPEDWETVLEKSDLSGPASLSRAEYARSLAMEAVSEFPHTAFVHRITRIPTSIDNKLNKIQPLLDINTEVFTLELEESELIDIEEAGKRELRDAYNSLKRFANLHPGLGLHEVFSKKNSVADTVRLVRERVGWLRTVFDLNPEVSFLHLDYLPDSKDLKKINFGTLSGEAQDRILADLKAYQRIYTVTNNAIPATQLMQAGFHSASTIALTRIMEFAGKSGLPIVEAQIFHAAALELANVTALQWIRLYEIARDKATTPVRTIPSAAEFFRPLNGFQELINNQPWCECVHCQSVLSPAAYFVDLMFYIEQNILLDSFKSNSRHPLHLQVRRPDLWDLELTCKNTNEYIPYLDLVNEILESYIDGTASHTAGTTIYKHLAEQDGSFKQPFTLPLERLEILLGHFGFSRYAVAKAMGSDRKIQACSRLNISQREYNLITLARTSTTDLSFHKQLFKISTPSSIASPDIVFDPMEMQVFFQATGLTHDIVEMVLKSQFVNTDGSTNEEITVVVGKRVPEDVQNNSELVKNLTLRRLDRIHRFIRLWRKLPWTVGELDYVLSRLSMPDTVSRIDDGTPAAAGVSERVATLLNILDLIEMNSEWNLPIDELMALFDVFPPNGLRESISLFDRLFNQMPFLDRDGRWPPSLSFRFIHPGWKKRDNPRGVSDPNNNTLSRLLAGLQLDDKELVELIEGLASISVLRYESATATADQSISLSKESISILYRHARLMRLLKVTISDFKKLIKLAPRIGIRLPAEQYIRDLDDIRMIVEFSAWQKTSNYSLDEIVYLIGGVAPEGNVNPVTLATDVITIVQKDKSFEFADTLFTQLGLTDLQSRQIVSDNTTTLTNNKAFEKLQDGAMYRLRVGVDPSTTQLTLNAGIDEPAVRGLLRKYHLLWIFDVSLAGAFQMSREQVEVIRAIAHPTLANNEITAITMALRGGLSDISVLTALITGMLRFHVMFKSKIFTMKSLLFVQENKTIFALPDNPVITMPVIRNVAAYVALATPTDLGFTTVVESVDIDALHAVLTAMEMSERDLAQTLRTDKTRIGALKPHLITLPSNRFDALDVIARCLVFTEQIGVSGETLSLMIREESSSPAMFDKLSRAAEDIFGAFRAKYPEDKTFKEKMEPFEDKLRARKRDGLVDFIVSKWPEPFVDANKLYAYFLIDVLMEGCARTSRVAAAISSLQLYVHRVLMNLEKSADLTIDYTNSRIVKGVAARFHNSGKRAEWYWRQHYRIWEANRKIFLHPENYIEPELRDDKTSLFKELEETLLQQEINESNVHDAYARYLIGFDELAHLSMAGAYHDNNDALHLFGVTQQDPPVYYYRIIEKARSELPLVSAWRKLNLQIPVRKVSPIQFEGRFYIFWLETTTRPNSAFEQGNTKFKGYRHAVRVKYSTLRSDGVWSPPQSLKFSNGSTTEESRIIDDPLSDNDAKKAVLNAQIYDLTVKESDWQAAVNRATNEVAIANVAVNTAVALLIASPTAGEIIDDGIAKVAASLAAATAAGPALAIGFPPFPPGPLAAAAASTAAALAVITLWVGDGATVISLKEAGVTVLDPLYRAKSKFAFWKKRLEASLAELSLRLMTEGLASIKAEKDRLNQELNSIKVSVRWDKSARDHSEPLDSYKPEGWEWDRVYPDVYSPSSTTEEKSIRLVLVPEKGPEGASILANTSYEVDMPSDILRKKIPSTSGNVSFYTSPEKLTNIRGQINKLVMPVPPVKTQWQRFFRASFLLNSSISSGVLVAQAPMNLDVQIVNGDPTSVIIESKDDIVWMREVPNESYLGIRLGTTLAPTLTNGFAHKGVSSLLEAQFQGSLRELPSKITPVYGQSDPEKQNPFHPMNFYLMYYRETFFHIPSLIANHLNSQQKFAETQRWYHYIFNPTAADGIPWRYREFRDPNILNQSLRGMLIDPAALAAYREEPFNPHAIARTRLSAYQKSIVMKYIDNLLDWGDSLFNQFTMESINEATMLYVMAQDILGPRPPILGSCGEGSVFSENHKKSYNTIKPGLGKASDFLIELEASSALPSRKQHEPKFVFKHNKFFAGTVSYDAQASTIAASAPTSVLDVGAGIGLSATQFSIAGGEFNQIDEKYWTNSGGTSLDVLYHGGSGIGGGVPIILGTSTGAPPISGNRTGNIDFINADSGFLGGIRGANDIVPYDRIPPLDVKYILGDAYPTLGDIPDCKLQPPKISPVEVIPPKHSAFCIPPNKDLFAYWGRVEDRLFKIRNCMDITGVRRQLELFQPEVDPRFLVRMKAIGLTLDDVLNSTSGNLPPYRFSYLIEKAKQHAGTLQSFGSQLLSAIEKRDGEELANLRAVHEQNLLKMRSRMMQLEIDTAEDAIEGLRRQKAAAEYRKDYFNSLSNAGLLASERKQQQLQRKASNFRTEAGLAQTVASILTIIPDVGAPTSMKFGGSQLGAAGRAVAEGLNALAAFNEMGASMAGMESSNRRRDQDWKHQVETAKRDILQIEKQITAAEIRRDIASHSLEVHEKTIDQSEELFDFLGTKFSSFGRYTLLSNRLHRLYRIAFNSALSMAKMTEQAYRAERTEDNTLLNGSYWDADNAGLLAGERLLIDLQSLELQYIETNYRQLEIEQAFSLAQFGADKLLELQTTGTCEFNIPEFFFDLHYPGQYRRRIKAVRLTLPCVVGPYGNVGATLTLTRSELRDRPQASAPLQQVPLRHAPAIAASSAQNDAGVFEFSFRDERFMPFEGMGAISTWKLSLPRTVRSFDYKTISDVILRINYTAMEDNTLRDDIERSNSTIMLTRFQEAAPVRIFSVRHDFPAVWAQFKNSQPNASQRCELKLPLKAEHFPFWASTFADGSTFQTNLIIDSSSTSAISIFKTSLAPEDPTTTEEKDDIPVSDQNESYHSGPLTATSPSAPVGDWMVYFSSGDRDLIDNLWLVINW